MTDVDLIHIYEDPGGFGDDDKINNETKKLNDKNDLLNAVFDINSVVLSQNDNESNNKSLNQND